MRGKSGASRFKALSREVANRERESSPNGDERRVTASTRLTATMDRMKLGSPSLSSTLQNVRGASQGLASVATHGFASVTKLVVKANDQRPQTPEEVLEQQVKDLKVTHKLVCGMVPSSHDILELFDALDVDNSGTVTVQEMKPIAKLLFPRDEDVDGDPDTPVSPKQDPRKASGLLSLPIEEQVAKLFQIADFDRDNALDRTEFNAAIKFATKLRSGSMGSNGTAVGSLRRYLQKRLHVSDSCATLPLTLALFVVYAMLIKWHLNIKTVSDMFTIMSEVFRVPDTGSWKGDRSQLLIWILHNLVPAALTDPAPDGGDSCQYAPPGRARACSPPGRVAAFNQLLGGFRLRRVQRQPAPCWQFKDAPVLEELYRFDAVRNVTEAPVVQDANASAIATDALACRDAATAAATPLDVVWLHVLQPKEEAMTTVQGLIDNDWVDFYTAEVKLDFPLYNAENGMFGITNIDFFFADDGAISLDFRVGAWLAQPYRDGFMPVFLDTGMVLILFLLLFQELQKMRKVFKAKKKSGTQKNLRKAKAKSQKTSLLSIWSLIDWVSVVASSICLVVFYLICMGTMSMRQSLTDQNMPLLYDKLNQPLTAEEINAQLEVRWHGKGVDEYEDALFELVDEFRSTAQMWYYLKISATFLAFSIMLRFFKSFRANPRMAVVTETIAKSSTELGHFLIVFGTITAVFQITAFILFGHSVYEFHTLMLSAHSLFLVLMGDFDFWQLQSVNKFATIWFWVFELLVYMLMLNMFLVIILDVYTGVSTAAKASSDNMYIWDQAYESFMTVYNIYMKGEKPIDYYSILTQLHGSGLEDTDAISWKKLMKIAEIDEIWAKKLIADSVAYERSLTDDEMNLNLSDTVRLIARVNHCMLDIETDGNEMDDHVTRAFERHPPPPSQTLDKQIARNEYLLDRVLEQVAPPAPPQRKHIRMMTGRSSPPSRGR